MAPACRTSRRRSIARTSTSIRSPGWSQKGISTFNAGDLKPPFGAGIANNIRFRDGSIYQSTTTKDDGTFAFTEVFPFFNFMVAEIDYARYKATSANSRG